MDLTLLRSEDDSRGGTDPDAVIETGVYSFDGFRWIGASASRPYTDSMDAEPDYAAAISLQLASLALTVAAVVVLKKRKG